MISKTTQKEVQVNWTAETQEKWLELVNDYVLKHGKNPVFTDVRPEASVFHLNALCYVASAQMIVLGKDPKAAKVLEIGSYMGQSAKIFAEYFGDVVCVDPYGLTNSIAKDDDLQEENQHKSDDVDLHVKLSDTNELVYFLMQHAVVDLNPQISLKRLTSDDYFASCDKDEKFDFIYIDGDHRYTQQRKDFENGLQFLNPRGIICGHDFSWEPTQKVIKDLQLDQRCIMHFLDDSFMIFTQK